MHSAWCAAYIFPVVYTIFRPMLHKHKKCISSVLARWCSYQARRWCQPAELVLFGRTFASRPNVPANVPATGTTMPSSTLATFLAPMPKHKWAILYGHKRADTATRCCQGLFFTNSVSMQGQLQRHVLISGYRLGIGYRLPGQDMGCVSLA